MGVHAVAERGYSSQYPENTLSSFQAAIDLGFTYIKLELHQTKDRVPVVIRDAAIDRMTNGHGDVRDYTYEELQTFTINHDEKIPSLEDVLKLAHGKVKVGIEIRHSGFDHEFEKNVYYTIREHASKVGIEIRHSGFDHEFEKNVYYTIREHASLEEVHILSGNHFALGRIRMLSDKICIGLLTDQPVKADLTLLKELKASYYAVKFDFDSLQQLDLRFLKENSIKLIVWTVNTIEKMKYMQQYPDALISTTELEKFKAITYPEDFTNWQKVGI